MLLINNGRIDLEHACSRVNNNLLQMCSSVVGLVICTQAKVSCIHFACYVRGQDQFANLYCDLFVQCCIYHASTLLLLLAVV